MDVFFLKIINFIVGYEEIRIVFFGKMGMGKSVIGNIIFGKMLFELFVLGLLIMSRCL